MFVWPHITHVIGATAIRRRTKPGQVRGVGRGRGRGGWFEAQQGGAAVCSSTHALRADRASGRACAWLPFCGAAARATHLY